MRLPAPEASPKDIVSYIDGLEDESTGDPNRQAWDASKQRWLDLYTGNHFASAVIALSGREPEELATPINRAASTVVRVVYNRVMNAILAHLAAQVGNSPKVVFNARESGEPPIYYLNGYVQHPAVQQMAMQMGMSDPDVQELDAIYGSVTVPGDEQATNQQAQQGVAPGPSGDGSEVTGGPGTDDGRQFSDVPGGSPVSAQGGEAGQLAQPITTHQAPHPETARAAQQVGMSIPLQEPFVTQLKQMIDAGRVISMQARAAGMPVPQDIIPPEALVEVTDQSKAQLRQTVFEALWEQCGGIEAVNESILNKKILGWQPTLVEHDRAKIDAGESPVTLTNVDSAQVYLDPKTSSFRQPQYEIMREPVPVEEAIAKYPDLEQLLTDKASSGTLNTRLDRNGGGGRMSNIQFERDMCVIRTAWIRNWRYPMDPDEALEKGKVQIVQVIDEQAQINVPRNPIATGQPTEQPGNGAAEPVDEGTPVEQIPVAQPAQPAPVMRQAFISTDTGGEVIPGELDWPIVFAIREIRDIEGEIIFDRRCRCPDIPLPCNINIPQPFSPYGIGEPDRLDGLQMAINRVLSDLLTFHRYNAYPPELIDSLVADRLPAMVKKIRSQPNSRTVVPHDITIQTGGDLSKLVQFMQMPQMSEGSWKLLEFLVEAIDKEAGNTDQMQGIAPSGSSGAWVANLQAAASQVMQVTSMSTEAWLRKVVRQILYFIDHVMTVPDIQKYCSKYPPPILAALHSPQKSPYIDISVEIQSGSAAAKQGQTASMIQAKQAGLPVSSPSIMERMNLDPDAELKREGDFRQKMLETGAIEQVQPEEKKEKPQEQAA